MELLEKIQQFKIKKAKKEVKKEVKEEKGKAETPITDVEASSSENVRKKKLKLAAEKTKYYAIKIVKIIVTILESVMAYLISLLGLIGTLVVLLAVLLMIVFYGFLTSDFVWSNSSKNEVSSSTSTDDCISSTTVSGSSYVLDTTGQLTGLYTEYQMQLYQFLSLYVDFFDTYPNAEDFCGSSVSDACEESFDWVVDTLGLDTVKYTLAGFASIENGYKFNSKDEENIDIFTTGATTVVNGVGYGFLGLYYHNAFDGCYAYNGRSDKSLDAEGQEGGNECLKESVVSDWKSKYSPTNHNIQTVNGVEHTIYLNYAPYGVATQLGSIVGSYMPLYFTESDSGYVYDIMDTFDIEETEQEELMAYLKLFYTSAAYHGSESEMEGEVLTLLIGLWKVSGGFENISVINTNYYDEGTLRPFFGISVYEYQSTTFDSGCLSINGVEVKKDFWTYVYEKLDSMDERYSSEYKTAFIDSENSFKSYSGKDKILNFHYGLVAYLQSRHVLEDIGTVAPLTSGGSIDDCDCYGATGVDSSDFADINTEGTKGIIQGPWSDSTKETMNSSFSKFITYMGDSYSIQNADVPMSSYGLSSGVSTVTTLEEWREETGWGVPYIFQSSSGEMFPESAGTLNISEVVYVAADEMCHVYMHSFMASAVTRTFINPVEMGVGLNIFGGVNGSGGVANGIAKAYTDLGVDVQITRPSRDVESYSSTIEEITGYSAEEFKNLSDSSVLQDIFDTVLSRGGIIGIAGGKNYFTTGDNHYVVIMGKEYNQYSVMGYRGYYSGSFSYLHYTYQNNIATSYKEYPWDYIYNSMFNKTAENYVGYIVFVFNEDISTAGSNSGC